MFDHEATQVLMLYVYILDDFYIMNNSPLDPIVTTDK